MIGSFHMTEVPDTVIGVMMLVVSVILVIWGITLIVAAFTENLKDNPSPWYAIRHWLIPGFPFWLGIFLITDAVLWGILGTLTLRSEDGVEAWSFVYIMISGVTGLIAFYYWARDRMPGGSS